MLLKVNYSSFSVFTACTFDWLIDGRSLIKTKLNNNFDLVLLNKLTYALFPLVLCIHQCDKTFMTQAFFYRLAINFVVSCVLFLQKEPPEVFCKRRCSVEISQNSGKHLCQSLLFNKVAGLRAETCNFI